MKQVKQRQLIPQINKVKSGNQYRDCIPRERKQRI